MSASDSNFPGTLPPCDATTRSNSPIMITHYDGSTDYIFICPWWLLLNEAAMQSEPFQPLDTRLTVYGLRNHIQLTQETVHEWRLWRNQALSIPESLLGRSDVALSWMAADIQLLNAVCKSPAKADALMNRACRRADLVACANLLWRRTGK